MPESWAPLMSDSPRASAAYYAVKTHIFSRLYTVPSISHSNWFCDLDFLVLSSPIVQMKMPFRGPPYCSISIHSLPLYTSNRYHLYRGIHISVSNPLTFPTFSQFSTPLAR
jgi:hypothetical protein